jgi:hypothetical protein
MIVIQQNQLKATDREELDSDVEPLLMPEPDSGSKHSLQQRLHEQRFVRTPLDQQDGGKRKRVGLDGLGESSHH